MASIDELVNGYVAPGSPLGMLQKAQEQTKKKEEVKEQIKEETQEVRKVQAQSSQPAQPQLTAEQIAEQRRAFVEASSAAGVAGQTKQTTQQGQTYTKSGTTTTKGSEQVTTKISPREAAQKMMQDMQYLNDATDLYYSTGNEEETVLNRINSTRRELEEASRNLEQAAQDNPIQTFLFGRDSLQAAQPYAAAAQRYEILNQYVNMMGQVRGNVSQLIRGYQDNEIKNVMNGVTQGETSQEGTSYNIGEVGPKSPLGKETAKQVAGVLFDMTEAGELPKEVLEIGNITGKYIEWSSGRPGAAEYENIFGQGVGQLITKRLFGRPFQAVKDSATAYTDLLKEREGMTPGTPMYETAQKTLMQVEAKYFQRNVQTDADKFAYQSLKPEEKYAKLNEFVNDLRAEYDDRGAEVGIENGFFTPVDMNAWAGEAAVKRLAGFEDGMVMPELEEALKSTSKDFNARNYPNYLREVADMVVETVPAERRVRAAQQLATMSSLQWQNIDPSTTSPLDTSGGFNFRLRLRDGAPMEAPLDLTNPGTWLFYFNGVIQSEKGVQRFGQNFGLGL